MPTPQTLLSSAGALVLGCCVVFWAYILVYHEQQQENPTNTDSVAVAQEPPQGEVDDDATKSDDESSSALVETVDESEQADDATLEEESGPEESAAAQPVASIAQPQWIIEEIQGGESRTQVSLKVNEEKKNVGIFSGWCDTLEHEEVSNYPGVQSAVFCQSLRERVVIALLHENDDWSVTVRRGKDSESEEVLRW